MAADTVRAALSDAWARIPQTRVARGGLGTFTRARIERIIHLVVALGSLALGAQALIVGISRPAPEQPGWHIALMWGTFIPLALMITACFVGRGVRVFAALFAVCFIGVLLLWPVATSGMGVLTDDPWIFYLINVATVAAVLAFTVPLQVVWAVVTPLLFGVVRLLPGGYSADVAVAVVLNVSFSLILGAMLITIAWLFRAMAANVDEVRGRAVESYAAAAAAEAAEEERIAVAGLMHDSVLAALIAANRAHSDRERALAVDMAREALTRLANTDRTAEEGPDQPVTLGEVRAGILRHAEELRVALESETCPDDDVTIPGPVARAMILAAGQAVANSVQHAQARGLTVQVVRRSGTWGVAVVVADRGPGFDLGEVPPDRLGIRGSIVARMAAVGGSALVRSSPAGTTVTLVWREEI